MPDLSMTASANVYSIRERLPDKDVIWQRFSVPFEYPVYFTEEILVPDNSTLVETLSRNEPEKRHKVVILVDDGLADSNPSIENDIHRYAEAHADKIELVRAPVLMPAGERIKTDKQHVEGLINQLAEYRIDRHSFVIAIGGGALLDAAGLAAATAHRGIRHVRIPTTVLAQNDSGVGVKNGINLFGQKNYLGTFTPPFAVINDFAFIRTLPNRDKTAGIAEAVKVALIRDAGFFHWLEENAENLAVFEDTAMKYMIRRCAELHMHQIANGGDPFETGSARPLDFGHWAAHRLEGLTQYKLRHGEAVAIGLALDTHYSVRCGLLPQGHDERVRTLLNQIGFTLWHDALERINAQGQLDIIQGLTDFREHLGGSLTITLLTDIGAGKEVYDMDNKLVAESIEWLKTRMTHGRTCNYPK